MLLVSADAQSGKRFALAPRLQVDLPRMRLLFQQQRQRVLQALQAGLQRFEGSLALRPFVGAEGCACQLTHLFGQRADLLLELGALASRLLYRTVGDFFTRLPIAQHPLQTKPKASHPRDLVSARGVIFCIGCCYSFRALTVQ
jgi:hypothetical protein